MATKKTIATLINEISFEFDRYDYESKDFLPHDEMDFTRKVLMEKLLDGLYFLKFGGKKGIDTDTYVKNKERQYKMDRAGFDGTEIGAMKIRGSLGQLQAARHKHEVLDNLYTDLQEAYEFMTGDHYQPYGSSPTYRFGTQNITATEVAIPDDILQMEAAMGIEPEVANDFIDEADVA